MPVQLAIINSQRLRYEARVQPAPEFAELTADLAGQLEAVALEDILRRFSEPDGVEGLRPLWGYEIGSKLVFDPESPLYRNGIARARFLKLATLAHDQETLQLNFLEFLNMLVYGASHGGHYSVMNCQAILRDVEILRAIWTAATVRPLNPRSRGTLAEYRRHILELGVASDAMPIPDWWRRQSESQPVHEPDNDR